MCPRHGGRGGRRPREMFEVPENLRMSVFRDVSKDFLSSENIQNNLNNIQSYSRIYTLRHETNMLTAMLRRVIVPPAVETYGQARTSAESWEVGDRCQTRSVLTPRKADLQIFKVFRRCIDLYLHFRLWFVNVFLHIYIIYHSRSFPFLSTSLSLSLSSSANCSLELVISFSLDAICFVIRSFSNKLPLTTTYFLYCSNEYAFHIFSSDFIVHMRNSLYVGFARPRETWLDDYCAQLSLLATQIIWTEDSWIVEFRDWVGGRNDRETDGIVGIVVGEFLFEQQIKPLWNIKVSGSLNQSIVSWSHVKSHYGKLRNEIILQSSILYICRYSNMNSYTRYIVYWLYNLVTRGKNCIFHVARRPPGPSKIWRHVITFHHLSPASPNLQASSSVVILLHVTYSMQNQMSIWLSYNDRKTYSAHKWMLFKLEVGCSICKRFVCKTVADHVKKQL